MNGYTTTDFGNNETMGRGIIEVGGKYVAMTFTQTRVFKTLNGAIRFLKRYGLDSNGNRIA